MNINDWYRECRLCPRRCKADRAGGKSGRCHVPADLRVARAALHFWEEPCISGESGSGTVFFSGCSLGCIYCQNREISRGQSGKWVTQERLAEIFLELQEKGAANINLVTPDHYAPSIAAALEQAKKQGLYLPVVCNCSGYMSLDVLQILKPVVDIWLTDFKYCDADLAKHFSGAEDYFEVACAALAEMVRAAGAPVFDENDMLKSGVIVRHLVLPGHTKDSRRVIRYLYETYGDTVLLSIMNQYTPPPQALPFLELSRRLTEREYDEVVDYAIEIGVEDAYIQEGETAQESFIPPFDNEGV